MTAVINADHPQLGMSHAFGSLFEIKEFDFLEMQRQGADNKRITEELVHEALQFKPEWLFLQLQNTAVIEADGIMAVRAALPQCVTTHWMGDCRSTVSDYLASICRATHMSFIAAAGQEALFKAAGAPYVRYVQIGLDWHEDVLASRNYVPPFRIPDVVMCGNHYGDMFPGTPQRLSALRTLRDAGIDYGVVGSGWPGDINKIGVCHVKEQIGVWRQTKVGLSISNFNEIPMYYSDRQIIAMASGTPIVCYQIPRLEEEFDDNIDCMMFTTNTQMIERVQRLLADEHLRRRIGEAGRANVLRNHTWFSRILEILPEIERKQRELAS